MSVESMSAASTQSHCGDSRNSKICVLIVDDEEPVRNVLTSYLEKFHYKPLGAANGFEACRKLDSEKVDIIISDNQMPGMSGVQLYRQIKRRFPDLAERFLLITGAKHDEEVVDFCRGSKAAFLEKPFQLKQISSILDEMVAQLNDISPAT